LIDEMRGSSSRGVFISVCVYRQIFGSLNNNRRLAGEPSGEPAAKLVAPRAVIYARFDERFSRITIALESTYKQIALSSECERPFPANKRADNSQSGMISENDRITC
jgi:hypothetical protein